MCELSGPLVLCRSLCNKHRVRGKWTGWMIMCLFVVANETWHISVAHHGVSPFIYLFVSIVTRKSCGSPFQSSGTACVTPTLPDPWRGRAAEGSYCLRGRNLRERCCTRTGSWSARSTPTRTAREVRVRRFHLRTFEQSTDIPYLSKSTNITGKRYSIKSKSAAFKINNMY